MDSTVQPPEVGGGSISNWGRTDCAVTRPGTFQSGDVQMLFSYSMVHFKGKALFPEAVMLYLQIMLL
jgi:hypothetical protein